MTRPTMDDSMYKIVAIGALLDALEGMNMKPTHVFMGWDVLLAAQTHGVETPTTVYGLPIVVGPPGSVSVGWQLEDK